MGADYSPPTLLVFFTHHRPHLATKDMDFFEKAKTHWIAKKVVQRAYQVHNPLYFLTDSISDLQPMFVNDPGDMGIRSVVHGWKLSKVYIDCLIFQVYTSIETLQHLERSDLTAPKRCVL